jgi:hypothetical protein
MKNQGVAGVRVNPRYRGRSGQFGNIAAAIHIVLKHILEKAGLRGRIRSGGCNYSG